MGNMLFGASFILSQETVIMIYYHHSLCIYFLQIVIDPNEKEK